MNPKNNNIEVVPFSHTFLKDELLTAIKELGFKKPTPIQEKVIPHLLSSNQDLIASAQTGTGKTAAFGLPLLNLTQVEDLRTQTIILCPTRELCIQITNDLKKYSKYIKGINIVAVYGGASIETQIKGLNRGAHIVIGTPGRTKDLIKRKKLSIINVERVILDEADEMLSMGFKEDLEAILAKTPKIKQTLLFSATMTKNVIAVTKKYMRNALEISVASIKMTAENVTHVLYTVQAKDRYEVVKRVADINPDIYGLVFCRTRRETKEIANKLMNDNYNADTLHGDLSQPQRDEVMGRFRKRQIQLLVATDVAARGLDVVDLTHVINYNLPDDDGIYIHRSGRTGRAGKKGISIAIVHGRETRKINEIENKYGISFTKNLVPTGEEICQKRLFALIDKIETVNVNEKQIEPFLPVIYKKLDWLDREKLIKHFVSAEFNRYLSYYKNAKDINLTDRPKGRKRGKTSKQARRQTPFEKFYINIGFKNKINPGRLIELINDCLNSRDVVIGHIEI
ncbi:MAG: DEAD/DEAH box helicase, partial [Alphaproteobacteria bacterium]|nr:DEAD/DEAH box helicase [Alphaproteobacteria bacterium]